MREGYVGALPLANNGLAQQLRRITCFYAEEQYGRRLEESGSLCPRLSAQPSREEKGLALTPDAACTPLMCIPALRSTYVRHGEKNTRRIPGISPTSLLIGFVRSTTGNQRSMEIMTGIYGSTGQKYRRKY
ncbi:hypothetical protein SKAU_G00310970 [Synaphobranchus kaupii]|uniref:Uncharacterized protein n=1 Tax=Synaphobranchus kaupii TaxID=118154 RepID=A0A9Q1IL17_SYNKA|nr:hypothetical protein SKAU_G00310970 [Synaphobranchus kaupii]